MRSYPSGDPTRSQADIRLTREVITVARPIELHDRIIAGRDGHASLKGMKLT